MYRLLLVVSATILSVSALAVGQTTPPSVTIEGGGVSPPLSDSTRAIAPQPSQAAEGSVLILPIAPPQGNYGWISRAFQEDIATDLTQMGRLHVIAPESAPAVANEQDAIQQGHQAGANYVIYGQARLAGNSIQVSGQTLDVSNGRSLGSLSGTAAADNLFPLEDTIALQAARVLPGSLITQPANPSTQPAAGMVEAPPYISEEHPAGPGYSTYPSTAYDYAAYPDGYEVYDTYPDSYYYPYWGGWWWGPEIVFVPGYGWHHHGWGYEHGWGYRGFRGGIYPHAGFRGGTGHGYGGPRGGFGGARGGASGGGAHGGGGGRR